MYQSIDKSMKYERDFGNSKQQESGVASLHDEERRKSAYFKDFIIDHEGYHEYHSDRNREGSLSKERKIERGYEVRENEGE